jgi:hypothetical protein
MGSIKWITIAAGSGLVIFFLGFLFQVNVLHSQSLHDSHQKLVSTYKSTPGTNVARENAQSPSNFIDFTEESNHEVIEPVKSSDNKVDQPLSTVISSDKSSLSAISSSSNPFINDGIITPFGESNRYLDGILQSVEFRHIIESEHFETFSKGINGYLKLGKHLPIVLLTCNRADLLNQTLKSLLETRNIFKENILISQDGSLQAVADIAKHYGLALIQDRKGKGLRGGAGGNDMSSPIALHYKFSLTKAFEMFPEAPALIIVEDDLLFSPDFLDYFEAVGPILDVDSSVLAVSAWNDNGFIGKVKVPLNLVRTEFFPGLGWMLSRRLYLEELEQKWPQQHWDHWLRSPEVHKGREIVHPEVPRTYHNGVKGTFMNLETHNRYFRDIAYNRNSNVVWSQTVKLPRISSTLNGSDMAGDELNVPMFAWALRGVYEFRIKIMMSSCRHAKAVQDALTQTG